MSQQTALVTGGTGFLGREVVKAFDRAGWRAIGTGFTRAAPPQILKCDLLNTAQVNEILDETRPHVVIHCAAERFPDRVEADPEAARRLNIDATRSLVAQCSARSCLVIYISTDYVFSGTPGEAPYETTAAPSPSNVYGQTKLDGEQATLDAAKETGLGVVLRVPVLYGPVDPVGNNKESAVNVLLDAVEKAQKGEQVMMDHWAVRYPTNTEDIGRVCTDIASKYLASREEGRQGDMPKILQFTAEEKYTKYEICIMLAEIMGYDVKGLVANKAGNDPNAKVQRPYDCHMSTKELQELGIDIVAQGFEAWWKRHLRAFRK